MLIKGEVDSMSNKMSFILEGLYSNRVNEASRASKIDLSSWGYIRPGDEFMIVGYTDNGVKFAEEIFPVGYYGTFKSSKGKDYKEYSSYKSDNVEVLKRALELMLERAKKYKLPPQLGMASKYKGFSIEKDNKVVGYQILIDGSSKGPRLPMDGFISGILKKEFILPSFPEVCGRFKILKDPSVLTTVLKDKKMYFSVDSNVVYYQAFTDNGNRYVLNGTYGARFADKMQWRLIEFVGDKTSTSDWGFSTDGCDISDLYNAVKTYEDKYLKVADKEFKKDGYIGGIIHGREQYERLYPREVLTIQKSAKVSSKVVAAVKSKKSVTPVASVASKSSISSTPSSSSNTSRKVIPVSNTPTTLPYTLPKRGNSCLVLKDGEYIELNVKQINEYMIKKSKFKYTVLTVRWETVSNKNNTYEVVAKLDKTTRSYIREGKEPYVTLKEIIKGRSSIYRKDTTKVGSHTVLSTETWSAGLQYDEKMHDDIERIFTKYSVKANKITYREIDEILSRARDFVGDLDDVEFILQEYIKRGLFKLDKKSLKLMAEEIFNKYHSRGYHVYD